jgi:hypothetical protein
MTELQSDGTPAAVSGPRAIDRIMRFLFWTALLILVPLTAVFAYFDLMGYADQGETLEIMNEMFTDAPSHSPNFHKKAVEDMAAHLRAHGLVQVSRQSNAGAFWFPARNDHDDWYGMADGTRVWVRIVRNEDDSRMIAWVVYPPRGWNIDLIKDRAHALHRDLGQWWQDYTASHRNR